MSKEKLMLSCHLVTKQSFRHFLNYIANQKFSFTKGSQFVLFYSDMEKGADTRTLSVEIFENTGNFWILDYYLLFFRHEKNAFWFQRHNFDDLNGSLNVTHKSV